MSLSPLLALLRTLLTSAAATSATATSPGGEAARRSAGRRAACLSRLTSTSLNRLGSLCGLWWRRRGGARGGGGARDGLGAIPLQVLLH